jgi:hypothetical protein
MESFRDEIPIDRLLEAAAAALEAAKDVADYTGSNSPYPLDLMGSPMQPACLAPFTRWEIEQACDFLVRMGFLERPKRPAA